MHKILATADNPEQGPPNVAILVGGMFSGKDPLSRSAYTGILKSAEHGHLVTPRRRGAAGFGFIFRAIAEEIEHIIDEYPEDVRTTLIGHSQGGLSVVRFALENPESVSRIVTINSPFGWVRGPAELFVPFDVSGDERLRLRKEIINGSIGVPSDYVATNDDFIVPVSSAIPVGAVSSHLITNRSSEQVERRFPGVNVFPRASGSTSHIGILNHPHVVDLCNPRHNSSLALAS